MNRLKLDWAISTRSERMEFVNSYIGTLEFTPNEKELETLANYILYGKEENGKNIVDEGDIEIETKYGTWTKAKKTESLDGLLESPTFNENQISDGKTRFKTPKVVFSREENAHIPELHDLWRNIDTIELTLNYYDLNHNKRKKSPRQELLGRFTDGEKLYIREKAENLPGVKYYKLRHLLVELRREQYTIRDSYSNEISRHSYAHTPTFSDNSLNFDSQALPVYPLGFFYDSSFYRKIFASELYPSLFTEEELRRVSDFLHQYDLRPGALYIDFTDMEHIYQLFLYIEQLEDQNESDEDVESALSDLLRTLDYYIEMANLDEIQKEILRLKQAHEKNEDIVKQINESFDRTYTSNYISTIFRQKICVRVADAAIAHRELIENLFFEENFKKCNTCGKVLLRSTRNFVRKSRSSDGFSNRCKKCDKIDRQKKKKKEKK